MVSLPPQCPARRSSRPPAPGPPYGDWGCHLQAGRPRRWAPPAHQHSAALWPFGPEAPPCGSGQACSQAGPGHGGQARARALARPSPGRGAQVPEGVSPAATLAQAASSPRASAPEAPAARSENRAAWLGSWALGSAPAAGRAGRDHRTLARSPALETCVRSNIAGFLPSLWGLR